jgi:hypothetical protein
MIKNKYSKFRFENNFNLKYSVNQWTRETSVLNTELRTMKPKIDTLLRNGVNANTGDITITNYIYSCEQVNMMDNSIAPSNKVKRVFFKLFNF